MTAHRRAELAPAPAPILPFYCVDEPLISPYADDVAAELHRWGLQCGLHKDPARQQRLTDAVLHFAVCSMAPDVDAEGLFLAARLSYWGTALDDRIDEGGTKEAALAFPADAAIWVRALEAPRTLPADDPWLSGLEEIGASLRARGTPTQFHRVVTASRSWLSGNAWQTSCLLTARRLDLDAYLLQRMPSYGTDVVAQLLALVSGIEVPSHQLYRPVVRALTETAMAVQVLDNERLDPDSRFPGLIAHEHGCDITEATRELAGIRDSIMCRFLELADHVTDPAEPELARYAALLRRGIRGNLDWNIHAPGYTCRRPYQPPETLITDRPADRRPVALPSIAWWWTTGP
jgi:hypothetical protein